MPVDERVAAHRVKATLRGVRRAAVGVLAWTVLAAGTAGCGDEKPAPPSQEQQVRSVVTAYGQATARKDVQLICDRLLASKLVAEVEDTGLPCEVAFEKGLADVRDPRLRIDGLRFERDRALVRVHSTAAGQPPSDDTLELRREGRAGWRISALQAAAAVPTPAAPGP